MEDLAALIRRQLGVLLNRLRGAQNISAIAREAGLSDKTLRRIRDGENTPSLDTIEKIVSALDKLEPVAPVAEAVADAISEPHAEASDRRDPSNAGQYIHPHRRAADRRDGRSAE